MLIVTHKRIFQIAFSVTAEKEIIIVDYVRNLNHNWEDLDKDSKYYPFFFPELLKVAISQVVTGQLRFDSPDPYWLQTNYPTESDEKLASR